jgi:ketosteroid isomerase-like protein
MTFPPPAGLRGIDRGDLARASYTAFAAGDRRFFDEHLAEDFTFSSPPDPHLDRDGWFERCWPAAGRGDDFAYARVLEAGDEVVVTYEARRRDGTSTRNTEVLTITDDKIVRTEVYFGWELADG